MKASGTASWLRDDWHWLVICILVTHFALGAVYSVVTPIWEGPDELGHYHHVRFLVKNLSLPGPEDTSSPLDQLTHPPLYYMVTAILTSWVDTGDGLVPVENPFAPTGITEGGANRFLHSDAETFPYRGTTLAVQAARLVSVALGTLVVLVTYWIGRLLFPERPEVALGAMAINAFSPGFLFMSSVINNDIMVTLLTALTLYFSVKVVIRTPQIKDLLAIGVFAGLALLSKYNALGLIPVMAVSVVAVLVRLLRHRRSLAISLGGVFLLLCSAAVISSWWFLRSVALFGTPTSRSAKILAQFLADIRDPAAGLAAIDWQLLSDGIRYFYTSFWATFGWGNVPAASWVYQVLGLLCLVGVAGYVAFLLGKASPSTKAGTLVLLLAFAAFCLLAIYRTLTVGQAVLRGRYVLPTISGISALLSLGVVQLTPQRLRRVPVLLVGVTMLLLGVIAPFRYIMPVYARPPIFTSEEASRVDNPAEFNFGNKVELLGYDLGVTRAVAGQYIPVTLYWRPLAGMEKNYAVGISLVGPDGTPYGQVAAYPGHGTYPTSYWKGGEIIEDKYLIRLRRKFPAPNLLSLYVALYTYPREEYLPVLDDDGDPLSHAAMFARLPVDPPVPLSHTVQNPLRYELGEQITLLGFDLDEKLFDIGYGCITLYWEAQTDMDFDYTIFIHVLDDRDQIVVQSDAPPRGGFYPTTYWREGETVADEHCIGFPNEVRPGQYQVWAGMYRLETMERLAVLDADGERVINDQIPLLERTAASTSSRHYVPLTFR